MRKIEITMKSGAVVRLRCKEFSVYRNKDTNDLGKLEWEGMDAKEPLYIRLAEIACITNEEDFSLSS